MLCANCHQLCPDDVQFCARCGSPVAGAVEAVDANDLLTGRTINGGRYQVADLLGKGGMGTVYRAHDIRLGRVVALKVLAGELVAHATARRRMAQEAQALARIEHPNVVRMFDVFDEGPLLVMALELVTGGDLEALVRPGGLNEGRVIVLMQGILSGLQAIHEAGLIHRDVKPGNVLLTAEGTPKITDLGVARDSQAREKTRLGATLGTPEYMSPEQIQGTHIDARSDVYSAGVVMFELLSGVKPFQGKTEFDWLTAHVHQPPELHRLDGKTSPALRAVVTRALEKKPELRFESAKAMAAALTTNVVIAPETMRGGAKLPAAQPPRAVAPVPVPLRVAVVAREALPQPSPQPTARPQATAPVSQRQDPPRARAVTAQVAVVHDELVAAPRRSMLLPAVGGVVGLLLLCGIGWAALSDAKTEPAQVPPTPVGPADANSRPAPDPAPPPSPPSPAMFVASAHTCGKIGWTHSNRADWLTAGRTASFPLSGGHSFVRVDANDRGAAGSSLDIIGVSSRTESVTVPNHELLTAKTWSPMHAAEWIAAFWYSESTIVLTVSRLQGDAVRTEKFTMATLPASDVRAGHFLNLDFDERDCGQRCIIAVGNDLNQIVNPETGKKWHQPRAQKYFALNIDGGVEECGGNWSATGE